MHPFEELILKSDEEILNAFHNCYGLKCKDYLIRLMECELYRLGEPHTHNSERQKEFGKIYVHRSTTDYHGRYKDGTYKGMDVTLRGGCLIRSIQVFERQQIEDKMKLVPVGDIVEGPCCVVDHLCSLTGWSMQELEDNTQIRKINWPTEEPIFGCRVGLTIKRAAQSDIDRWAKQLMLPRRSALYTPKKDRKSFFALDPDRLDIKFPSKQKWLEEMKEGNTGELSRHMTLLQVAGFYKYNKSSD